MLVRRVEPGDWESSRALRLEALADYPLGYLQTLASAQAMDDDAWRALAVRSAVGGDTFQVLALDGERVVGTSVSFVKDGVAWLAAVYITPTHRGTGLLSRLVHACSDWVRAQGRSSLDLEVHEANTRARRAYEKLGFVPTGDTRAYPLTPGGCELRMRLSL